VLFWESSPVSNQTESHTHSRVLIGVEGVLQEETLSVSKDMKIKRYQKIHLTHHPPVAEVSPIFQDVFQDPSVATLIYYHIGTVQITDGAQT